MIASSSCTIGSSGKGRPVSRSTTARKRSEISLQVFRRQAHVLFDAGQPLDLLELVVEGLVRDAQGDLAEQLDETTVGVVAEALVAGLGDQSLQGVGVQTEVQDGVHHARHGHGRTGTHRDQQGIIDTAEDLAGLLFQVAHVLAHLVHDARRQIAAIVVQILQAGVGRDHEAGRHIEPDLSHFAQIGALAAQQHLVFSVAFFERVYVFGAFGHRPFFQP